MASRGDDAPYDPYIPSGGAGQQAQGQGQNGNHRTAALQAVCNITIFGDSSDYRMMRDSGQRHVGP
jgi:hypothetical protein